MGTREYYVRMLSSTDSARQLGDLPIRQVNGAMVFVKEVDDPQSFGGYCAYHSNINTSPVRLYANMPFADISLGNPLLRRPTYSIWANTSADRRKRS